MEELAHEQTLHLLESTVAGNRLGLERAFQRDLDHVIQNCEDLPGLCDLDNVGRRVQVDILIDTGISNCISTRASVLAFRFFK